MLTPLSPEVDDIVKQARKMFGASKVKVRRRGLPAGWVHITIFSPRGKIEFSVHPTGQVTGLCATARLF